MASVGATEAVEAKILIILDGQFFETTHLVDCTINDIQAFKRHTFTEPFMQPSRGSIRDLVEGVWRILLWYDNENICARFIRFYKTAREIIAPRILHLEIRSRNRSGALMRLYNQEVVTSTDYLMEESPMVTLPLTQRRGPVFFTVRFQSEYARQPGPSSLGGMNTDAVLFSADGQSFPVHRHVLMAHFPVFRAMFHSGMMECISGECHITDINGEIIQLMVDYMYGKSMPFIEDIAVIKQLLVANDKYDVDGKNPKMLKAQCEGRLTLATRDESKHNKELQQLADQFELALLKKALEDYAVMKKAKVPKRMNEDDLTVSQILDELVKPFFTAPLHG